MRTTTIAALAPVLTHLATLTTGAMRTGHAKNTLRVYRAEEVLPADAATAANALVMAGAAVKVYAGTGVYTGRVADDGVVTWTRRETRRDRRNATALYGVPAVTVVAVTL